MKRWCPECHSEIPRGDDTCPGCYRPVMADTLTLNRTTILGLLIALATVGVILGVFGLIAAFKALPPHEDHIVVVMALVMFGTAAGVITWTRRQP